MYTFSLIRKSLTLLAIVFSFTLVSANSLWAGSDGMIEDKDTIENRGPGNLDTPTEKAPKAEKAPEGTEKTSAKPAASAEKKAEEKAEAPATPK